MSELKSCPHCNGPARLETMPQTQSWHRVRCADFKCGATTWAQASAEAAVEVWNRRDGEATDE